MNKFFTLRRAAMFLALALPSLSWGFIQPKTALIVDDGSGYDFTTTEPFLSSRLVNAGFTVTTSTGVPVGSLSGYNQVWDIRFSTTLSGSDITAYTTYVSGGGALFALGEGPGFVTRDNSILSLITGLGGGSVTLNSAGSQDAQTVQAPFTGPVTLSTVNYNYVGGFATFGNGHAISLDTNNVAGAIVLPPGSLTSATNGTLISALDVNFISNALAGDQALTDNLIAYLAAPTGTSPSGTPAPATLLLVLLGLGAAGLYAVRRRNLTA